MKNTKLILGLGAVELAIYLFRNKFKSTGNDANFSNLVSPRLNCLKRFCPPNTHCVTGRNGRTRCVHD